MKRLLVPTAVLAALLSARASTQEGASPERDALQGFLDTYNHVILHEDPDDWLQLVSLDGLLDLAGDKHDRAWRQGFAPVFAAGYVANGSDDAWRTVELLSVERVAADDQLWTVVSRARFANGRSGFHRWWIRRESGAWKLVDREDLDTTLRLSTLLSALIANETAELEVLTDLANALEAEDWETVEAALRDLDEVELEPALDTVRWVAAARAYYQLDRPDEAWQAIERAEETRPGIPVLHLVRAGLLNDEGEHAAALEAARAYEKALAPCVECFAFQGDALAGLGRIEEAIAAYERGLEDDPASPECFLGLATVLPDDRVEELRSAFRRVYDPVGAFDAIAWTLWEEGRLRAIEVLLSEVRTMAPDERDVDFYQALLLFGSENYEGAAALFHSLFERAEEEDLPVYVDWYLEACLEADVAEDGYANAPDPDYAFAYLADALYEYEDLEELRALVGLHRLERPEDALGPAYAGYLACAEERHEEAVLEFERAEDLARDAEERSGFRADRIECLYHAGRALEAYAEVGPREETYQLLVDLCLEDDRYGLLTTLLTRRRADRESDPETPLLEAYVAFATGRSAEAAQAFLENEATLSPDLERIPYYEVAFVRSAVRSGRLDAALRAARASTARDGDPYLEAVVHGALGEPERALQAMETCLGMGYAATDFLGDPDLGPVLEGEAYAAFRRAHTFPAGDQ